MLLRAVQQRSREVVSRRGAGICPFLQLRHGAHTTAHLSWVGVPERWGSADVKEAVDAFLRRHTLQTQHGEGII